ncbi:hypothetical protein P261_01715 [Lachnospiraceae bacterium TWA4]|nr:hypothetical protein P261_01715 [Lachnospiraceae bacterium TWA4]
MSLGMFFSYVRSFAACHNPLGANLINYATFVGVIHHELSHALLVILTGAKLSRVQLFNLNHSDGFLGSVSYYSRGGVILKSIQKTLISVAPIFMGLITCSLMYTYLYPIATATIWGTLLFYYVWISIILHMSLSHQDIEVMKEGIFIFVLLMTVIFYVFHIDFVVILLKAIR